MRIVNLFILAVVMFAGCAGPRVVSSESPAGANLSAYKTFDFYKVSASGDTLPDKFHQRTRLIEDAISSELAQRGYSKDSVHPDMLVNIGIVVNEKLQTRTTDFREAPVYIGQRNYHWKSEEKVVGRYRLGTATVDLVDAKSNKLIWKAVVEDVVPEKESKVPASIQKGIHEMFTRFPK